MEMSNVTQARGHRKKDQSSRREEREAGRTTTNCVPSRPPAGQQSAHQRKHRAFRQELADKTGAACAHGSANAQLLFTLGGLRKQKIGKIDAASGDEADDAHEHAGKRELLR